MCLAIHHKLKQLLFPINQRSPVCTCASLNDICEDKTDRQTNYLLAGSIEECRFDMLSINSDLLSVNLIQN